MGTTVAIIQSNYIPWKGYFDLINSADEFVIYDDVQYTKNDWRNRNVIKTRQGPLWLSIPIKRNFGQRINEATVSEDTWSRKHWLSITQTYARAPFFGAYADRFAAAYEECSREDYLSKINYLLICLICDILNIRTRITWAMDYPAGEDRTERLVQICKILNASHYISGPAARNYLSEELFSEAGIQLSYMDYTGYPEYPQLFGEFEHRVSIVDLIFNAGSDASKFMKSF